MRCWDLGIEVSRLTSTYVGKSMLSKSQGRADVLGPYGKASVEIHE